MLRTIVSSAVLVTLAAVPAGAEIGRICDVSYQKPDGSWSAPERREVVFHTGRELSRKSSQYFNYDAQDEYAVVTWSQGDVTVIELDANFLSSGDIFSSDDFTRLFAVRSQIEASEVSDPRRRRWRIVAKEGVPPRFIDTRAKSPH
jgi:hypothetical protein